MSVLPRRQRNERSELSRAGVNVDAVRDQHRLVVDAERMRARARWGRLSIAGGALLLGLGLWQRSWTGLVTAVVGGGALVFDIKRRMNQHAAAVPDGERSIRVEKMITIAKPVEDVYAAWSDLTALPRILSHLRSVTPLEDGKTHWVANAPLDQTVEWDAETVVDQENRVISWRSVGGTPVPNVGAVRFHEAPGDRGTEVRVRIEYNLPLGSAGAAFARLFGEEPGQQIEDDLRRFKAMLETGEAPTTQRQPRGGSTESKMDSALQNVRRMADTAASVTGTR